MVTYCKPRNSQSATGSRRTEPSPPLARKSVSLGAKWPTPSGEDLVADPDSAIVRADMDRVVHRLHCGVREERNLVGRRDLGRALAMAFSISPILRDRPRIVRGLFGVPIRTYRRGRGYTGAKRASASARVGGKRRGPGGPGPPKPPKPRSMRALIYSVGFVRFLRGQRLLSVPKHRSMAEAT
jgi:hypothetical protein